MQFSVASLLTFAAAAAAFPAGIFPRQTANMTGSAVCGNSTYSTTQYKCWNTNLLCPVVNGTVTYPCGSDLATFDCYNPAQYHCVNATLYQGPSPTGSMTTATGFAKLR